MKNIVLGIQNGLLSEAIQKALIKQGEFRVHYVAGGSKAEFINACILMHADILLLEVSYVCGSRLNERLDTIREVKKVLPLCKGLFLCDEQAMPDVAREIVKAKQDGRIDGFYYNSVTESYLTDSLVSI